MSIIADMKEILEKNLNIKVKDPSKPQSISSMLAEEDGDIGQLTEEEFESVAEDLSVEIESILASSDGEDDKLITNIKTFVSKRIAYKRAVASIEQMIKENKKTLSNIDENPDFAALLDDIFNVGDAYLEDKAMEDIASNPLVKKLKKKPKLLDPSSGVDKVKEELEKVKTKFTLDKTENAYDFMDAILEDDYKMDEKKAYNNFNSMNVEGVSIVNPATLWNGVSIPSGYNAYHTSPARTSADTLIRQTVRSVRKIKKLNNEDKETGLKIGKKINMKQIHRKDGKYWTKKNSPDKEEADLSIYIALDFSGSTHGGLDRQIAAVGLGLTEAFEKLKIKHTIMAYSNSVSIIKRGIKATPEKMVLASPDCVGMGGNNEHAVFKTIETFVSQEKEEDVLVMIITDGDGSGEETGLKSLQESLTTNKRVEVHAVGLNYDGGSFTLGRAQDIYGVNNAHVINNKQEFGRTVGEIIRRSILRGEE